MDATELVDTILNPYCRNPLNVNEQIAADLEASQIELETTKAELEKNKTLIESLEQMYENASNGVTYYYYENQDLKKKLNELQAKYDELLKSTQ